MKKALMSQSEILQYKTYTFERDLKYIRYALLVSAFIYAVFGMIDYLFYPDYLETFLKIRFLLVVPAILLGYAYSYHKSYRYVCNYVLIAVALISALGIILMIYTINEANYYYAGLFLILLVSFFLLRLKPLYSSILATLIIITFVVMGLFQTVVDYDNIISNGLFYLFFSILGILGTKYFEEYRLNQFYHERIIVGEKVVLEKQVYKQYEDIKNYHSATIFALAKLAESRDKLTGDHINRVSELAYSLALKLPDRVYEENNIPRKVFENAIKLASSLHDIGKITILDSILNKPGKLTKEEFEIIKTHTTVGYNILREIEKDYEENTFISLGKQIAKSHHEKWDGHGYPEGLAGENIPLCARIVAIVDVYDALISVRPYKEAFTKEKSLEIIREGSGSHFDPIVSKVFIKMISESNKEK